MIEIKHLKTIATLKDSGSLTATAITLHMTQSALSHQLKDLEKKLGSPVFLRKTNPIKFTPEGDVLLGLAEKVLPLIQEAQSELSELKQESGGRLHMALECHSCFQWLMPSIKEYQTQWPEVTLDLASGFGFDPLSALMTGDLDLVITSDIQPRSYIHYEPLFDFEIKLITSPEHPLSQKRYIEPDDLANSLMLSYPVHKQRLDIVKHFMQPKGVEPKQWKQADNTLVMIQMVSADLGVASLPNWAIDEFMKQGMISAMPLGKDGLWRRLFAAVRVSEKNKPFIQAFFSTARTRCKQHLTGIKMP
ncbi:LysR substrate-binding domain-containing protein [Vibrio sp.]|nr:LysR substrate-binding domain-containing protein [Vibrio sp.]